MFSPLEALDSIKLCLGPCFGSRASSSDKTETTSSYDDKHTNNVRAKLGKPAKPAKKIVESPIKMVATPAAAFETGGSASNPLTSKRLPPLPGDVEGIAATTPLTVVELGELFDQIDETLSRSGIQYAICGLAAMLAHGLTSRGASTVSMVVPERSKDVILAWARAGGHTLSQTGSKASFDIQMRDGTLRGIKVRYVHGAAFDKMDIIGSQTGVRGAKTLNLASLLELIASGFQLKCQGGGSNRVPPPQAGQAVEVLVRDMHLVLEGAIARAVPLRPHHLELFLTPDFWLPLQAYLGERRTQGLAALAARARLPIADVFEEARRRSDVRQHDEFLSTYGAPPMMGVGARASQAGTFNGMRSVAAARDNVNTSSIYTLGSKASHGDLGGGGVSSSQAQQQQQQAGKGRSLTGSRLPPSRLGNKSVDDGQGRAPPVRKNSVKPPPDPQRARTSMDMVDPQKGRGRPDGWL